MANGSSLAKRWRDLPGLIDETPTYTNNPVRQQVENNANNRSTDIPKDTAAAGESFVQGQGYRDKHEPRPSVPPEEIDIVIQLARKPEPNNQRSAK